MLETSTWLPLVSELLYANSSSSKEAKSGKTLDQSAGRAGDLCVTEMCSETAPPEQPEALGLHQGNLECHAMDGSQVA